MRVQPEVSAHRDVSAKRLQGDKTGAFMTWIDTDSDSKIDMERIIAALSPQQRRAVHLYSRGYTYREIGAIMGVSENAIKQSFKKIRMKFANVDTF